MGNDLLNTPETRETMWREESARLRGRWTDEDPEGGTRAEAILRRLREGRPDDRENPKDFRGIRLAGEDLSGLDFSGCDFSEADLTGAVLKGCRFPWARFVDTTLSRADLSECEFMSADLTRANLSECVAERVGFGGCDLTEANLFAVKMNGATFTRSKLIRTDLRVADLREARIRDADLTGANLVGADLRGVDFTGSEVSHAGFDESDMRRAHLKGIHGYASAGWVGADIRDVDFCGAYLVRRHILDENYLHEFRNRDARSEIVYRIWRLSSDCGRSVGRWSLWTMLITVVFAFLYAFVVDVDYGNHETALSPFYYSVVTLTTLGYGDVLPASGPAQVVAMIEVVLGYVALGGLLSIFANKMARRAD